MAMGKDEEFTKLVIEGVAAGCALIGLLANGWIEREKLSENAVVTEAWSIGDKMVAEFLRRGKMLEKGGR